MTAPSTLRSPVRSAWTGITTGRCALCSCTWAFRRGIAEIKYLHRACIIHGGAK